MVLCVPVQKNDRKLFDCCHVDPDLKCDTKKNDSSNGYK